MSKITAQIIAGIGGIWLASAFIPKVEVIAPSFPRKLLYLALIGGAIGLVNFFVKPALDIITYPIRVLTLGLFSLILDMGVIWAIEIVFYDYLTIVGIIPLFWTTLIILVLSSILPRIRFPG